MDYDIIVIGAGPAGLAFARSVAKTGLRIALIDRQTREQLADPAIDGRDIALTHLSRQILQRLDAWSRIPADEISPLQRARVIDGDSAYTLDFDNTGRTDEPLGYLVANHLIRKALYEVTASLDTVTVLPDTEVKAVGSNANTAEVELVDGRRLSARLLIGADTRLSHTRQQMGIGADMRDFGRVAIVCRMQHELSHGNTAWECFHYGRTLAILPMPGNASSIVITVPADLAPRIVAMDTAAFNTDIEERFDHRLGSMRLTGERFSYPLVAVHAKCFVAQRFALIGDAAVGMHPVTAHGFNLGLSGVDLLSDEICGLASRGADIADPAALARYQTRHRLATLPLFHGTNEIVSLFTDDRLPARLARKAVLRLSNHLPPVKWVIKNKLVNQDHVGGPLLQLLP